MPRPPPSGQKAKRAAVDGTGDAIDLVAGGIQNTSWLWGRRWMERCTRGCQFTLNLHFPEDVKAIEKKRGTFIPAFNQFVADKVCGAAIFFSYIQEIFKYDILLWSFSDKRHFIELIYIKVI